MIWHLSHPKTCFSKQAPEETDRSWRLQAYFRNTVFCGDDTRTLENKVLRCIQTLLKNHHFGAHANCPAIGLLLQPLLWRSKDERTVSLPKVGPQCENRCEMRKMWQKLMQNVKTERIAATHQSSAAQKLQVIYTAVPFNSDTLLLKNNSKFEVSFAKSCCDPFHLVSFRVFVKALWKPWASSHGSKLWMIQQNPTASRQAWEAKAFELKKIRNLQILKLTFEDRA